jgi:hypothetical protein
MVCLVVDKETIDSVLASSSSQLDKTSSIKVLQREFDEADMRKWAPKLVCRYTGLFRISPEFLPTLDGRLDEDASYAHPGNLEEIQQVWAKVVAMKNQRGARKTLAKIETNCNHLTTLQ